MTSLSWIVLLAASFFEIAWALGLVVTNGFTNPLATVLTVICMIASFVLLAIAVETLPVGTAYTVWTGIGATGTVLGGILFFDESADMLRLVFIVLIIIGVGGLKLSTNP